LLSLLASSGINYVKVVPAVSISFMVYEHVRAKLDEVFPS